MSHAETDSDGVTRVRVMNDHGVNLPVWPDDPEVVEALSEALVADLEAFAERWDAAVDPQVFDDRWDHHPVMRRIVEIRHALDRLLHPARQRAARSEAASLGMIGESLARRVQEELGPGYRVTYVPC